VTSARQYVIGDIHGAHKALLECFEKASFDRDQDLLICLGDICDGWPEVNKVFDELLTVRNLVYILGNHDKWALDWFINHNVPPVWTKQGGNATIESYEGKVPGSHAKLLSEASLFYRLGNKVFVHGGFNPEIPLEQQEENTFLWDRKLVHRAIELHDDTVSRRITGYDEVYVGHTPTINFGSLEPVRVCEVIIMDTGAGWPGGVLTMMDIDSGEIFQSSPVDSLYPDYSGRDY
jgi:serine/threonine protein phosphatase 1